MSPANWIECVLWNIMVAAALAKVDQEQEEAIARLNALVPRRLGVAWEP